MTKNQKQPKSVEKTERLLPIVIVPDKTYLDNTGHVIPTDLIVITGQKLFDKMQDVLKAWGEKPLGIPGTRNGVEG